MVGWVYPKDLMMGWGWTGMEWNGDDFAFRVLNLDIS